MRKGSDKKRHDGDLILVGHDAHLLANRPVDEIRAEVWGLGFKLYARQHGLDPDALRRHIESREYLERLLRKGENERRKKSSVSR